MAWLRLARCRRGHGDRRSKCLHSRQVGRASGLSSDRRRRERRTITNHSPFGLVRREWPPSTRPSKARWERLSASSSKGSALSTREGWRSEDRSSLVSASIRAVDPRPTRPRRWRHRPLAVRATRRQLSLCASFSRSALRGVGAIARGKMAGHASIASCENLERKVGGR